MSKTFNKVIKALSTVLVVLVFLLVFLLVGVRLFGLQVYVVLSGSMEPAYHTGSIIYVADVDPAELEVGDPVTFKLGETSTIATHRIIEITSSGSDPSDRTFRTKGDANENEDAALLPAANVLGKPVFTIPLLGYVAAFIQQPPGTYLAIAIAAVILMLIMLPELLAPSKKKEEPESLPEESGSEEK